MSSETSARNTLIWRLQTAYKHPHREHLLLEAADEIERLRAEVAWWRDKAVDYAYDDEKCECDRCVEVRTRHESTN